MNFYEELFGALEENRVRYLVVGGVAVMLHGFVRATADLDLLVALDKDNLRAFLDLMKQRGYKPRVPVPIEDFADPKNRQSWIEEKGMRVFSLIHSKKPQELIDIFVEEPMPFAEAYSRRKSIRVGSTEVSVMNISDLIRLKQRAGRSQDLQDVQGLQDIEKGKSNE